MADVAGEQGAREHDAETRHAVISHASVNTNLHSHPSHLMDLVDHWGGTLSQHHLVGSNCVGARSSSYTVGFSKYRHIERRQVYVVCIEPYTLLLYLIFMLNGTNSIPKLNPGSPNTIKYGPLERISVITRSILMQLSAHKSTYRTVMEYTHCIWGNIFTRLRHIKPIGIMYNVNCTLPMTDTLNVTTLHSGRRSETAKNRHGAWQR